MAAALIAEEPARHQFDVTDRAGVPPRLAPGLLTPSNRDQALDLLTAVLRQGVDFKLNETLYTRRDAPQTLRDRIVGDLPDAGCDLDDLLESITGQLLPFCKNEASPRFLGFGDTGADVAALAGALMGLLTQQNMINQSFDSPSATFAEITATRWLRELIGYTNPAPEKVSTVWEVGGVITTGGTMSNTVAMMLAREHAVPGTMTTGVRDPGRHVVLVPQGIGHYSISSSLAWIGCGAQAVPVPTANFRYDLGALADALAEHAGRVMAVVAYAGDSRTQTLEDLRAVHDLVRGTGESIWLHVDACWGLMAALTPRLAHRLEGITQFDSVTVDPHKVLDVPYSVSALLVRDPAALRSVSSFSDLIMQEDFALGQVTPFLGTRGWTSLSLWSLLRAHGRQGLARIVEDRLDRTAEFVGLVDAHPRLLRLNEPDMTAVTFMVLPVGFDRAKPDLDGLNRLNIAIHDHIIDAGRWHLHQFSLPDPGHFQTGTLLHPLRFNGINRRITTAHLQGVLDYLLGLADAIEHTPAGAR